MNAKSNYIGITGIGVFILFIFGNTVLFVSHPELINEIRILSVASYNFNGFVGQNWAAYFNYITVGIVAVAFLIQLLMHPNIKSPVKIPIVFLLISALLYTSLGVVSFDHTDNVGATINILLKAAIIVIGGIGLIYLSFELERIIGSKIMRYATLFIGISMMIVGHSAFTYIDEFGALCNYPWVAYFLWYGLAGFHLYRKPVRKHLIANQKPPYFDKQLLGQTG